MGNIQTFDLDVNINMNSSANSIELLGISESNLDLTYEIVGTPTNGTATINSLTGIILFTPTIGFYSEDDLDLATVSYRARDSNNNYSNESIINIFVINCIPTVQNFTLETVQNTPITFNFLGSSPVNNQLTYSYDPIVNGTISQESGTQNYTFDPDTNFSGQCVITYYAKDNSLTNLQSTTATLTINVKNVSPIVYPIGLTSNQGNSLDIEPIITRSTANPIEITALNPIDNSGSVTVNSGIIRFTPNVSFTGTTSFTYTARDTILDLISNSATISIGVLNSTPVSFDISSSVNQNQSVEIKLIGDSPADNSLNFEIVNQTSNGTLNTNTINSNNIVKYIPNNLFFGTDSFTYRAVDSTNNEIVSTNSTVNINIVDTTPIIFTISQTIFQNQTVLIELLGISPVNNPLIYNFFNITPSDAGTANVNDNILTFIPNKQFIGNVEIQYSATDDLTKVSSIPNNILVSIINATPQVLPIDSSITVPNVLSMELLGSSPVNNELVYNYYDLTSGSGTINILGNTLNYTPNNFFKGIASVNYTATDPELNLTSEPALINITVTNNNSDRTINYIKQNTNLTQELVNSYLWPVYIYKNVIITFEEDITLNDKEQYFIMAGSNIKINGNNKKVFINGIAENVGGYLGLFQNGYYPYRCLTLNNYDNITIKNLGVISINSVLNTTKNYEGGWLCQAYWAYPNKKTLICKCYSDGIIGKYCGGIVGSNSYVSINKCYSNGNISNFGGGIIGAYSNGIINNCYTTGTYNCKNGIVGYKSKVFVFNSIATKGKEDFKNIIIPNKEIYIFPVIQSVIKINYNFFNNPLLKVKIIKNPTYGKLFIVSNQKFVYFPNINYNNKKDNFSFCYVNEVSKEESNIIEFKLVKSFYEKIKTIIDLD